MKMNRSKHATPQELIELLPYIHYLHWNKETKDFEDKYARPNAFERDGLLFISSEDSLNADLFVYDTYGEVRATEPIHPTLNAWAERLGTYFEQYDNASIVLNPADIKPAVFQTFLANNATLKTKSDVQLGLEHQTGAVIKELRAIRNHIWFKLETSHGEDTEVLIDFENKILDALHALEKSEVSA